MICDASCTLYLTIDAAKMLSLTASDSDLGDTWPTLHMSAGCSRLNVENNKVEI